MLDLELERRNCEKNEMSGAPSVLTTGDVAGGRSAACFRRLNSLSRRPC